MSPIDRKEGQNFGANYDEYQGGQSPQLANFFYEKGPENSEPFIFGGGENRTLVLNKRCTSLYMLRAHSLQQPCCRDRHLGLRNSSESRTLASRDQARKVHTKMYDGNI